MFCVSYSLIQFESILIHAHNSIIMAIESNEFQLEIINFTLITFCIFTCILVTAQHAAWHVCQLWNLDYFGSPAPLTISD